MGSLLTPVIPSELSLINPKHTGVLWVLIPNLIARELRGLESSLERDTKLLVRPSLGLRNPQITPDQTDCCKAAEEEPELAPQIQMIWIDHIRNRHGHENANRGLCRRCNGNGLGPHFRR
jgi:hypothetical protein